MSILLRTVQIFAGLGGVTVIPLTLSNNSDRLEIKFQDSVGQQISEKMTKILEEKGEKGYKGCVALEGSSHNGIFPFLYVCINSEDLSKPFLFHYDSKVKPFASRISEVKEITYSYSYLGEATLKEGSKKTLRVLPFWMSKWKDKLFKPEEHCKLTKSKDSKYSYQLTCQFNKGSSEKAELTQNI